MHRNILAIAVVAAALGIGACEARDTNEAQGRRLEQTVAPGSGAEEAQVNTVERPITQAEIAERADMSFSDHPLGTEIINRNALDFTLVDVTCGQGSEFCTWRDPEGVLHVLDGNNILFIKKVEVSDFAERPIGALGIGSARNRSAVVENVSRFLHGTSLECLEQAQAGEGEGIASCGASLGEGWIKVLFGPDNQLISARIDAYQAN